MTTFKIVLKELFERKSQLITSFMAILLGITVIVSIKTITFFSQNAVAEELDNLGANALIIPKSASINDYYRSDFAEEVIPESYVDDITLSSLQGILNLSPKLTKPITVSGKAVNLTGVLPKSDFKMPPAWDTNSSGIFTEPQICGTKAPPMTKNNKMRRKIIESLDKDKVIVGYEAARLLNLKEGSKLDIDGRSFTVQEIYPETGTVDDTRILAHLHVVQEMYKTGRVVNVIEIVGCCNEIKKGMLDGLNKLLPDAKVVTINQIVKTQQNTNEMLNRFSLIFLIVIVLVGGVSIANYMFSNVQERRKEIAILLSIGTIPNRILWIFLLKALLLGIAGGIIGYLVGTILAMILGPQIAGIPIFPLTNLFGWALVVAVAITIVSSLIPAYQAARIDPVDILQEV